MVPPPLGRHIRRLRRARNWSQAELSERADLSEDTIRRLENESFYPRLLTLLKVCAGLGITPATFFSILYDADLDHTTADLVALLEGQSAETVKLATAVVRALTDAMGE